MGKPTKLVVDSSVIVKWVNSQDEQFLKQADALISDSRNGKVVLFAPELVKYEVGNALWKKGLSTPQAKASLETIYSSPVEFIKQNESQAMRTMEMALETGMTFYDASFVSLAEAMGATLVTDNPKHQKRVRGIKIIEIKDY